MGDLRVTCRSIASSTRDQQLPHEPLRLALSFTRSYSSWSLDYCLYPCHVQSLVKTGPDLEGGLVPHPLSSRPAALPPYLLGPILRIIPTYGHGILLKT